MRTFVARGLRRARRGRRGDAGFTLPELIIAVAIGVLIMGSIAAALIVSVDSQGTVQSQLTDSSASQITSAFYTRDVQSAIAYTTYESPGNGPPACPDPAATSFLLGLYWSGSGQYTVVSYWDAPSPDNPATTEIVREACVNGATTPSNVVLADEVSPLSINLTFAGPCAQDIGNPGCPNPSSGYSDCTTNPSDPNCLWLTTSWVADITLNIGEPSSGYQFSLAASPRIASAGSGGGPTTTSTTTTTTSTTTTTPTTTTSSSTTTTISGPTTTTSSTSTTSTTLPTSTTTPPPVAAPLVLLGSGNPVISCSGFFESIQINGAAYINSAQNGSVLLQGGAISLKATGGLFTPDPSGAVVTHQFFGSISYTQPTLGAPESDPYAGLTPPAVPSAGPGGSPVSINTSQTLAPGNYGQVNISGANINVTLNPGDFGGLSTSGFNVNVKLNPGTYIFNGPVTLGASGGQVTLSPGAYLGGLHISGANIQVTLASGVYIFQADQNPGSGNGVAIEATGVNDVINGTAGVVLYVNTGSVKLVGFGQSLNLAPMTGSPYGSIVLWQDKSDPANINVLGFGIGVVAVGGTIYAPSATLGSSLFEAGSSYALGGLVANGLYCPGFGNQLTITG